MLNAVRDYLLSKGLTNVYVDFIPDYTTVPECIAVFCWQKSPSYPFDGTASYRIQIQVRRKNTDYNGAMSVCQSIANYLDSGEDEAVITLVAGKKVIGRMTSGAAVMPAGRTDKTLTTYAEVVLFGDA